MQYFRSIFIESGSGQKSTESGSRLNLTLPGRNKKLFYNSKIFMSKEVNKLKDKMFKELKLFCVDLTFYIFCKTLDPDPDPEDPWIRIRNTGGMN